MINFSLYKCYKKNLQTIAKMTLDEKTEPLEYWGPDFSTTSCTHFIIAVYFVLNIVLNIKQTKDKLFTIIFSEKCSVILIGSLKPPKSFGRNSIKPEVLVIF